jgi:hypothetical protein
MPLLPRVFGALFVLGLGGSFGSRLFDRVLDQRPAQLPQVRLLAADGAHGDVPLTPTTIYYFAFRTGHERHPPFDTYCC